MDVTIVALLVQMVVLFVLCTASAYAIATDGNFRGRRARVRKLKYNAYDSNRAYDLFTSLLTPRQLRHLKRKGQIKVRGGTTHWKYVIRAGTAGNVTVCRPMSVRTRDCYRKTKLCCHLYSKSYYPMFDHMAAQLLHIRHHEVAFLNTAYPRIVLYD